MRLSPTPIYPNSTEKRGAEKLSLPPPSKKSARKMPLHNREQQENMATQHQQNNNNSSTSIFDVDWQKFVTRQLVFIRQLQQRLERRDVENAELKERLELLERRLERSERRPGPDISCTKELDELKPLLQPNTIGRSSSAIADRKKSAAAQLLSAAKRRHTADDSSRKSTVVFRGVSKRRRPALRTRTTSDRSHTGHETPKKRRLRPVSESHAPTSPDAVVNSVAPKRLARDASRSVQPTPTPQKSGQPTRKQLLIHSSELLLNRLDDVPPPPQLVTPSPPGNQQRRLSARLSGRRVPVTGSEPSASRRRPTVDPVKFYSVPGFRVCKLEPLRTARGGDEDMTDAAFEKRHSKHEKQERMIVRRDKARQRELLLREAALRAERLAHPSSLLRLSSAAVEADPDVDDNIRRLDDLRTISIVSRLPKGVFVVEALTESIGHAPTPAVS